MKREPIAVPGLAERLAAGEIEAIRDFYDATSAQAYGLALRVAASPEAASRACEEAYASLPGIVRKSGREPGALQVAFYGVVRELSLSARNAQQPASTDSREPSHPTMKVVRDCLDNLDPSARRALELAYFGGLGIQAIAEIVGQPVSELRPMMRSALLRIGAATRIQQEEVR